MSSYPPAIPLIDLQDYPGSIVNKLSSACAQWGFFHVINHGIDSQLVAALQWASREFFCLPTEMKHAVSRSMDNPFGYYDRELTKNLRDRKEIFDFAPNEVTPIPPLPPGFRNTLDEYGAACHKLSLALIAICCDGLGAPRDSLAHHFRDGHSSFLRLNYYPLSDSLAGSDAPAAGPHGISQHTDAGAITILLQDEVAGLQVWHDETWLDVAPVEGAMTINIGDMLQVWSNDRYRAPLHRVRASARRARYSAAYFCNPDYHTTAAPLNSAVSIDNPACYRPIPWAEFRRLRAMGDYGDYGEEVQIFHYRQ